MQLASDLANIVAQYSILLDYIVLKSFNPIDGPHLLTQTSIPAYSITNIVKIKRYYFRVTVQ